MAHILNREIFMRLSEESQAKVEHIYNIASMLSSYQQPQMTVSEFDDLYDKSLDELERIVGHVRSHCHAAVYPNIEGE